MAYTVLGGSQVLPGGIPKRRWYNDVGELQGTLSRQFVDVIAQALLASQGVPSFGKAPTTPTPRNPGQLQFPSGASTATSPGELDQIRAMGGIPSRQGTVAPIGQQPGGIQYNPPTSFQWQPNLDRQAKLAAIQQAQANLARAPLEQQKLQADIDFQKQLPEIYKNIYGGQSSGQPSQGESAFGQQLSTLRQAADGGDEQAVQKIRLILQLLQQGTSNAAQ